jgi:hypothetical protein
MLAVAKVLFLALAMTGVSATGLATGVAHTPMTKAIEIHKDHLGTNSTLPQQAMKGQQTAYDHLMKNQERWLAKNHTWMPDDHDNETDDLDDAD